MKENSPLRRPFVKISLLTAVAAWFALIALMLVRSPTNERNGSVCGAIVGWPVSYALGLALCWVMARFAGYVDESWLYGPAKDLQLKALRGPMIWWINIAAVLYPLARFVLALVALIAGPVVL
jgi:hypothetical protein